MDAPQATLEATISLALRSIRQPQTALAAVLAAYGRRVEASVAAVYLVPLEPDEPELIASSGRDAVALGPPGPVPEEMAPLLLECVLTNTVTAKVAASLPSPWGDQRHVSCLPGRLVGDISIVLALGGAEPVDARVFEEALGPIGLLANALVSSRREEALRQELHRVRQEHALLAAGLQHDLKTPLTSILGCAMTLSARGAEIAEERRSELLGIIAAQSERLNGMVTEALSRHASGPDAPIRLAEVDPLAVAERVARAARSARGGEVALELSDERIVTDEQRLERALLNLVDNALKYSPDGEPVHVVGERSGDTYRLTVADAGPGVAPEVAHALFTPYARDPNRAGSTGLGLHSVSHLVGELGGRVTYRRRDGWSRFSIVLPSDPRVTEVSEGAQSDVAVEAHP